MLKKLSTILFIFILVVSVAKLNAEPRRMVLEFCTGTWCGWCPCGHQAADQILTQYPNTIVIAYHGASSDPWQNFQGNAIRSLLGFSAYPTGVFDRTNHPGNNGAPYQYVTYTMWSSYAQNRYNAAPNSNINVAVTATNFNPGTRQYTATINAVAQTNLSAQYKICYVLTEDNVVYPQNFYSSCGTAGYHNDYVHKDITRIVPAPTGENLNSGIWNQNQTITKNVAISVDTAWVAGNCRINILVYKDSSDLFFGAIEQGTKQSVTGMVGVSQNNEIPSAYSLSQNYPNPFNPVTNIQFSIPNAGFVSLKIYNSRGQLVETYTEGYMSAGTYNADFDGTKLASGVYFYTLTAGNFRETKKMVLVK